MKKLLLSILFPLFFCAASQAQSNYDLQFDFKIAEDSLRAGDTTTITGIISNNGPNAFSGTINFNVSVFFKSEAIDYPLDNTDIDFPLSGGEFTGTIPANGNVNITVPIILLTDFWKSREDSTNIVIVWPSDSYQDDNNDNNYGGSFSLYIIPDSSTGIAKVNNDISLFNLYPNPAKNEVKISFESVRKGQISLTDITGRTLLTQNISAGSQYISMPLKVAGQDLPEGMYFINVQTDNQRAVKKLYITR